MQGEVSREKIDAETIKSWLANYLADLLELEVDKVDFDTPFERYGLDSSSMIVLSGDLQDWLNCKLKPTLLYDYPNIDTLARYLEKIVSEQH